MRYITFKDNVRFKRWTPALAFILSKLHELQNLNDWLPDLVVTSVNDSAHSKNPLSRHYTDEALDIRSHNFTNEEDTLKFIDLLKKALNPGKIPKFTVLYEDVGLKNEHIHVQVMKGKTFS